MFLCLMLMMIIDTVHLFLCNFTLWPFNSLSYDLNSFSSIILCFCINTSNIEINLRLENEVFVIFSWTMSELHLPTCKVTVLLVYRCSKITQVLGFLSVSEVGRIFKQISSGATFVYFLVSIILESRSKLFNLFVRFNSSLLAIEQLFFERRR